MRGLLTLVAKEWKDVRVLTAAAAVIVVAACLAVRWYLGERYSLSMADFPSTPRYFEMFVPACAALYATLIAADVVGGEVASRRIDLVELLPAGRGRVWAAKALFLLLASTAFTVGCALVQAGVLAAIDGERWTGQFVAQAFGNPWAIGLVATFAGSTLLVSTIGLRGLSAALVGGVVALGLFGGAYQFAGFLGYESHWYRPTPTEIPSDPRETIAALWLPPVVLAAAGLAYRFGRVHLGRVLRPASIALGILVAALAGPAAALAYDAMAVVPGRAGTNFRRWCPSPDGRFVALEYVNESSRTHATKLFVLDTERGVLVEPEVSHGFFALRPGARERAWDDDGSLVVCAPVDEGIEHVWVEPSSGVVRRRSTQDLQAWREDTRAAWDEWQRSDRWDLSTNRRCDDGGPTYEAIALDSRSPARPTFRTWAPAGVPRRSGLIAYFPEPCILAVRALPDGEERRLLTAREPWLGAKWQVGEVSPDGRLMLVWHDGTWKALDLETGATTPLPRCGSKPGWWTVQGDASRSVVVVKEKNGAPYRVVDLATGAALEFGDDQVGDGWAISDGRLVVMGPGQVLALVDRDLKLVRRLWPAAKK